MSDENTEGGYEYAGRTRRATQDLSLHATSTSICLHPCVLSFNRRIADTTMKRSARRFSKKIPLSVRSSRQNTAIRMLNDLEAELRYLLNPQIASWRIFEYLLLIRKALSGDLHPRLGKVLRQRRAGKRERGKSLSHRSPLAPRRSW